MHNYLNSVEARLQVYEKIRDGEEQIHQDFSTLVQAREQNFFFRGGRDMTQVCHRDRAHGLRCISVAMLLNDLEKLRDDYLIWDQKLVKAFQEEHPVKVTYEVLGLVLKNYLNPEEYQVIHSFLQATQAALTT